MMDHAADRITQGLTEALAHAKGEMVSDLALHISAQVDVPAIPSSPAFSGGNRG